MGIHGDKIDFWALTSKTRDARAGFVTVDPDVQRRISLEFGSPLGRYCSAFITHFLAYAFKSLTVLAEV